MSSCWLGIDGCKSGWVVFLQYDDGNIDLFQISSLSELKEVKAHYGEMLAIGIDIPIGLADCAERGGRGCDREARRILSAARRLAVSQSKRKSIVPFVGPSSIFTPPSRPALNAFSSGASHSDTSQVNIESNNDAIRQGLGLSIQAFHIMPKIKEADDFLQPYDKVITMAFSIPVFECHPEVAFLALRSAERSSDLTPECLSKTQALLSKKHIEGRRHRLQLLQDHCSLDVCSLYKLTQAWEDSTSTSERDYLALICQKQTWRIRSFSSRADVVTRVSVAADDVVDAIICAHSANRWRSKKSIQIYEEGSQCIDSRGLPMLIQV